MDRKQIREMTMQLIYQMDATGDFDFGHLSVLDENVRVLNKPQAVAVLTAARDHINDIDEVISACLDKWTIDRVSRTDLAIIRRKLVGRYTLTNLGVIAFDLNNDGANDTTDLAIIRRYLVGRYKF